MYLKTIEVQGFKSFANKTVFEFHNGLTCVVGPNGSGKSNVADAVRWVLGEQRIKQLRGSSMQDVIFAGTENRKPLSYAYVAITLDNSDRQLNVDYNEVTIARRLYRSGESEYLMNGSICRLKDVNELFYDTGIGKEGYSLIGQGQIERILSGKPEERRELFDEAAGIVKYKRRKAAAQKKLEDEQQNLTRVKDILTELERQIGPLERQSEKARIYLKKKEELKVYDVNLFLLETDRIQEQLKEVEEKLSIAGRQFRESQDTFERIRRNCERTEEDMAAVEESMDQVRREISDSGVAKERLSAQIEVLKEQINGARKSEEHFEQRRSAVEAEEALKKESRAGYEAQAAALDQNLAQVQENGRSVYDRFAAMQEKIASCQEQIEAGKAEIIEILNRRAATGARMQHFDTMLEQNALRKARLSTQLLEHKGEENALLDQVKEAEEKVAQSREAFAALVVKQEELETKRKGWIGKLEETNRSLQEETEGYHKDHSRLESMKNIAERYDGYGNSIRRVMEYRSHQPGILGVVADLIQSDKKYELAIETALGGNIQNIVTKDEETAKELIGYLKKNRFGRVTFLPLTSVTGKKREERQELLKETGVLGVAADLVQCEARYRQVVQYLLGRTIVVDEIDHAIALARKYQHSLHIVTLEGEYLNPGGAMTGGAFQNTGNLLGRKREIEELEKKVADRLTKISALKERIEEIQTARELLKEDLEEVRQSLQEVRLAQNTAELTARQVREHKAESDLGLGALQKECAAIEEQNQEIQEGKEAIRREIEEAAQREKEIEETNLRLTEEMETESRLQEEMQNQVSQLRLQEANISQQKGFVWENITRICGELQKLAEELADLEQERKLSEEDIAKKEQEIGEIQETILASDGAFATLEEKLLKLQEEKDALSKQYKNFFQKREELSQENANLDKEMFRLTNQREKLEDNLEHHASYMWQEYELTYHNALPLLREEYKDLPQLKTWISGIKDEIRKLGDVNVNAIEDYKEVAQRYTFLKTQHDDLITAEETLLGIIKELDEGMRKQFREKFSDIQHEFDKTFRELFGGGKGTLELVEDEDILECGIRIIAQPPGKKLQNMMQLSGGEKALTAIALLFAIQNLKPSPFCLLDEIEAALDDSNVGRFAQYLHRLTKRTQFIVITHRRGTMTAADRLYGITMQEKGVSALVSVNLIEKDLDE